jgi:hypothetical protein
VAPKIIGWLVAGIAFVVAKSFQAILLFADSAPAAAESESAVAPVVESSGAFVLAAGFAAVQDEFLLVAVAVVVEPPYGQFVVANSAVWGGSPSILLSTVSLAAGYDFESVPAAGLGPGPVLGPARVLSTVSLTAGYEAESVPATGPAPGFAPVVVHLSTVSLVVGYEVDSVESVLARVPATGPGPATEPGLVRSPALGLATGLGLGPAPVAAPALAMKLKSIAPLAVD